MSTINPDGINPFRAPRSEIGTPPVEASAETEAVRRANIRRESAVRSIGTLGYFAAGLAGLILAFDAVPNLLALASEGWRSLDNRRREGFILDLVGVTLFVLPCAGVGRGLRGLRPWARWVALIAAAFAFLVLAAKAGMGVFLPFEFFFGEAVAYANDALWLLILGSIILQLIRSGRAGIFAPEYREVIRQTPSIRCPTSRFAWAVMLYTLVGIAAVAGRIFYARSKLGR